MEGKGGLPPPTYIPPPPGPGAVIVTHQPLVLGPQSAVITCPSCHAHITTVVKAENTTKTHLIAIILCLVCFPCVCVPYCMDSCKSKNHYCPNCHAFIGRYEN